MKKGLAALLCLTLLTGCTRFNVNVQTNRTEPEQSAASLSADAEGESSAPVSAAEASGEASAAVSQQEDGEQAPYLTVSAAEAYEGAYSFVTEETGTYRFVAEGPEDLSWEVYVLEEEFEDAPRYLAQAYEPAFTAVSGEGEKLTVLPGDQYIYCVCSVNSMTADEPGQDGTLTVYFTATDGGSMVRAGASGVLELDAADLWNEGGYSFQARRDATYTLTRDGEADWEVYVLDGDFEDALRYLPQAAEPAAVNEGSFSVKLGQMVYCLCGWNSFTEEEAPELGTNVLHLTEE